jgi:hypothetical protein
LLFNWRKNLTDCNLFVLKFQKTKNAKAVIHYYF